MDGNFCLFLVGLGGIKYEAERRELLSLPLSSCFCSSVVRGCSSSCWIQWESLLTDDSSHCKQKRHCKLKNEAKAKQPLSPSKPESNNCMFVPSHLFSSREGGGTWTGWEEILWIRVSHRDGDEWNLNKKEVCLTASDVSLEAMPLKQEHNYRLSILK